MKSNFIKSIFVLVILLLASLSVFSQDADEGLFPTVGVYLACLNKQVGQFDNDLSETRVKPKKCALGYPKYCNDARMSMMEDCVRCSHISCPSGTFCDQKKRKCLKGVPPPVPAVQAPVPSTPRFTKLPDRLTVKSAVEHVASQKVVIVALPADFPAAQYVGVSLEASGATVEYVSDTSVDPVQFADAQLVVVGGPCANVLWTKLSEETCSSWDFRRKGVIKTKKLGNRLAVLLAGSSLQDTFALANVLIAKYNTDPQFGAEKVLL